MAEMPHQIGFDKESMRILTQLHDDMVDAARELRRELRVITLVAYSALSLSIVAVIIRFFENPV